MLHRRFFSSSTPGTTVVNTFASFKPIVSRVVLRVHPDVLIGAGISVAGARSNESSLVSLLKLVDGIRTRCGEGGGKVNGMLAGTYDLSFWHAPPKSPTGSSLIRTRHAVILSPSRETALDTLVKNGKVNDARALWLALALNALRPLAEATGSVPRGGLILSPSLQLISDRDAREANNDNKTDAAAEAAAATKNAWKPESTDAALRTFLMSNPPLAQGKSGLGHLEDGLGTGSVFSARQRRTHTELLMAKQGWLIIEAPADSKALPLPLHLISQNNAANNRFILPGPALAAAHLRRTLTDYHDALHLYHPLWDGVQIILTTGGKNETFDINAQNRILKIPSNFQPIELVRFVRTAWPSMLQYALLDARRGGGGSGGKR